MATATSGFVLLDVFVPEILQYCHAAPTILLRNTVKNVVIEFCKRTLCLKAKPASFYMDEDKHTYTLKYASDRYMTLDVEFMRPGDDEFDTTYESLVNTTKQILDSSEANWQTRNATSPSQYFLTDDVNALRVFPTPNTDSTNEYYVDAIVCPKKDQTEVPEFLYEKWEDTIQAGALARLLAMPGASWRAPKLAGEFHSKYRRGLRNARKTTLTGIGQVPAEVTPRSFIVFGRSSYNGGI